MSLGAHVALFGAGVASCLAPCVLPLVPAYLAMMAGEVARSTGAAVRAAGLFVVGFTAVFVALGALAGRLGSSLESVQVWITRVGGIAVVVFGLMLLGVIGGRALVERRLVTVGRSATDDDPVPTVVAGGRHLRIEGTVARPLVMGLAFGAAWTPCVGPLLGAALVVAAESAAWQRGATLLAAYAVGIGVPFVALALALPAWPELGVRLRAWSGRIERVAGAALVVLGLLLVSGWYDELLSPIARLTAGA